MTPDFDRAGELAFARAVLAGHESSIVKFEKRIQCVPRILRSLNGRRGSPLTDHDLADLAQDTILIVLRKLDQFEAWVPLEGWIYRLCYLEFLNASRKRGRMLRRTSELDENLDALSPPSAPHAHDDLHTALTRLGGVEAEAIRLKHFDDLTFQEIGDCLNMPANTAKTRYYRGLAKLEALIRTYQQREERA